MTYALQWHDFRIVADINTVGGRADRTVNCMPFASYTPAKSNLGEPSTSCLLLHT